MECTAETDELGHLIQREIYTDNEEDLNFDPREVFRGDGGGIGGRGGGRGDGTTRVDPTKTIQGTVVVLHRLIIAYVKAFGAGKLLFFLGKRFEIGEPSRLPCVVVRWLAA